MSARPTFINYNLAGVYRMNPRWLLLALLLATPAALHAGEEKKKEDAKTKAAPTAKTSPVPYRMTDTSHVLLRVKINGKGPFNFVVDTGCPVFLIAKPVGEKIGLKTDAKGWAILDKLELEGGLVQNNVKAMVQTPFQIEGMNSMGLPGVELHGLMGYTVLAKYKMQFDFTSEQMDWLPLKFDPAEPAPITGKSAAGGMDMMVGVMKMLSFVAGIKPAPPPLPRGFIGFELAEKDKQVFITRVLPKSPAAEAGLKVGDRVFSIDAKEVATIAEVQKQAAKVVAGMSLRVEVMRGETKEEITITAGEGF
jgi:membrane-associated protease RseP (regulator of RpoE activity)